MEVEQTAEVSSGETTDLKSLDKISVHDDDKENLGNGNSNPQVKETHSDEDDGTGSDGFELIDVKENFDSAKMVEDERASPRNTSDISALTKGPKGEENSTESRLEELSRRIKELESEKDRLIEDMTKAETEQTLQYNSLQQAKISLTEKDKELADATQSLREMGSELESSKRRIQETEAELHSFADKLHKLEELKDERSLHAAQEAKRAAELDKMLEMAQFNMKEMENQISSLQGEIKGHEDKSIDHQKVEESLSATISQLKMVQEALELSKSQVADLEQKLASQDANISKLTEELSLHCSSEETVKLKSIDLETKLSEVHEELEGKLLSLQEMEMKLEEHAKEKLTSEATLEKQEVQIINLQAGFDELKDENETLKGTVVDSNSKLSEKDSMLHQAEEELAKAQLLLSEALSHKEELEVNLESINEQHGTSKAVAENANKKILDLEAQVLALHATEEALKLHLEEGKAREEDAEKKLTDSENKLVTSVEQLKLLEEYVQQQAASSAEKEKQLQEAVSSVEEHKEKTLELQSFLDSFTSKNQLLEQEVKDLTDKFSEHQEQAHSVHQRSLELESLLHTSKSDADGAHTRRQELELELDTTYAKFKEVEAELELYKSKVSHLSDDLEAYQTKAASLEAIMEASSGKEKELMESLRQITEEKKRLEELTADYEEKLRVHFQEKQSFEERLQSQELKVLDLEGLLSRLGEEKESKENTIADLKLQLSNKNDMYIQLESQLSQAGDDHSKTRSLLSDAHSQKEELEINLRSLNDLHIESKSATESAIQRITELETQVEELSAAEQSLKLQLTEFESKFASAEKKSIDLEQELKGATDECNICRVKIGELTADYEEKLQVHLQEKQSFEERLQSQELKVLDLEGLLAKLGEEKESDENTIADLNLQLSNKNDMYIQLESQLSQAGDDHSKTRSLLSDAHSHKEELERNLSSLNDLHIESKTTAESAVRRITELETQVEELSAAEQSLKLQLTEFESKFASAEKKSIDLEQELKGATEECNIYRVKIDELTADYEEKLQVHLQEKQSFEERLQKQELKVLDLEGLLARMGEEKESDKNIIADLNLQLCNKNDMYIQLESQLSQAGDDHSTTRSLLSDAHSHKEELERNLRSLSDLHIESTTAAESAVQRVMELETQVEELRAAEQSLKLQLTGFESKFASAEKKSIDLEQELKGATEECNICCVKIDELSSELEAYKEKSKTIEASLVEAEQKETELENELAQANEQKEKFEDLSKKATVAHLEAEKQLQTLQAELKSASGKIEEVENDLQALGIRESSVLDKLKSAEEQLEHRGRALEHATSKKVDLESLYQSLLEDTEMKLQQAADNLTQKETEYQELSEKMKLVEEQVSSYQAKAAAATEEAESMKVELEAFENEICTLENTIEELKIKVSSSESKAEQAFAESATMSGENQVLKGELDAKLAMLHELQEQFNSTHAEKEDFVMKLAEHGRTIEHLTEVHSRGLDLQSEAESRYAEIEAQMREALEIIGRKDSEHKDLNERLIALQSETESLIHVNEALKQEITIKMEEAAEKLVVHEKTIEHLTEEHSKGLDLQSSAESRNAEIESQLREVLEKMTNKESEVTDLKKRLISLEVDNEQLAGMNEVLKAEMDAKVAMFDELNERFSATSAEKEEALEKLVVHAGTITHLTEVHTRNLELHAAAESKNEEIEVQLHEALELKAQKEAEVTEMSKKLDALDIELGYYEEQATEAAATEENHKVKFDEAMQKIKSLEEQLLDTQNKVEHFHTEKENLVIANGSLNEEMERHQNKLNELQLALAAAIVEKQGSSEEIHSLRKTLDGMIQRKEELESQFSFTLEEHEELKSKYQNALEEKHMLNEKYEITKKELDEAISKLEQQMNVEKSEKQLHISKLERQITVSELKYMEEIQTMQVETTEKDDALKTKIQEHANILHEKDELEQQLLEVRKELDGAYHTIANQEEQASVREIKWDAYKKYSADQLEAEQQHAAELEIQVSTLKQQLQEAEIHYKQKEEQVSLRNVKWEEDHQHSVDELKSQRQYAAELEKQIATLTEQLELAEIRYKEKVAEEKGKLALANAELSKLTQNMSKSAQMEKVQDLGQKLQLNHSKAKDVVASTRSREFSLDSSALPDKQRDRSQAPSTASPNPTQQELQEPSGIMAFKFILGVALLSVIIGVFLGKRY